MWISEDIQRELVYGLNALLLAWHPHVPTGQVMAERLLAILAEEGPRFHEPDLVAAWAADSAWDEELPEGLSDALDLILEELADQEEPFSAHDILGLLAEEPFWTLQWGGSGGQSHVPIRRMQAPGLALPLSLRGAIVVLLDALEKTLHTLHMDQRSVHDALEDAIVEGHSADTVRSIRALGDVVRIPDLPHLMQQSGGVGQDRPRLPPRRGAATAPLAPALDRALSVIQRWKLTVGFDAHPDEDDGEWTMRVLERLYRIDWFVDAGPAAG